MTDPKQTAMAAYGFAEWPGTHIRTRSATDARASAAVMMRNQGFGGTAIAKEVGYSDKESACGSIRNYIKRMERETT